MRVFTFKGTNKKYTLRGGDDIDITMLLRGYDGDRGDIMSLAARFIKYLCANGFRDGAAPVHSDKVVRVDLAEELATVDSLIVAEKEL